MNFEVLKIKPKRDDFMIVAHITEIVMLIAVIIGIVVILFGMW